VLRVLEYKWTLLSVMTIGGFMASVDGSIVIVGLPSILHDLSATLVEGVWVVAGYTLVTTILLVALGRVGDMFGRVRLYNLGFAAFTVFSALCGLSQTGSQLVIFRLAQGIGAALLIVNSVALVADAFPASELGLGIGVYFMAWNVGAIAGYTLGGLIVGLIGWRFIFFVNIPVGIFGTVWGHLRLKDTHSGISEKFDYLGTALFSIALTLILVALTIENTTSSPNLILPLGGALALLMFVLVEKRTKYPALDLSLFRVRVFTAGNIASFLNSLAFNSLPFVVTLYLQLVRHVDPLTTGLMFVPMEAVVMVVGPLSGRLSDRYSARGLSSIGLLFNAIAIFWFSTLEENTSFTALVVALACLGFGRGLFASPNAHSIMGEVPQDKLGVANGVRTTVGQAAAVVSVPLSLTFMSLAMPYNELSGIGQGALLPTVAETGTFLSALHYAVHMSAFLVLLAIVPSLLRGRAGHKSG
jgi:EmrB/QacA subfamily drug resistance transporter